ncbi:hypothetical protein B0T19DRAFT_411310 [Cercophora scortea]|uniref:Secreted protein n=1 Tax=Cercophora scortea TaxID=314031 RepID=A0AAE0J5S2_9PEZI|nr:hypothetical protein B0T19DRAFT_411310 [Cercophora scortea]
MQLPHPPNVALSCLPVEVFCLPWSALGLHCLVCACCRTTCTWKSAGSCDRSAASGGHVLYLSAQLQSATFNIQPNIQHSAFSRSTLKKDIERHPATVFEIRGTLTT